MTQKNHQLQTVCHVNFRKSLERHWRKTSRSFNISYNTGKVAISQKWGITKLICVSTKDADANLIKNWHPLTLIHCYYKIAAKATAELK